MIRNQGRWQRQPKQELKYYNNERRVPTPNKLYIQGQQSKQEKLTDDTRISNQYDAKLGISFCRMFQKIRNYTKEQREDNENEIWKRCRVKLSYSVKQIMKVPFTIECSMAGYRNRQYKSTNLSPPCA